MFNVFNKWRKKGKSVGSEIDLIRRTQNVSGTVSPRQASSSHNQSSLVLVSDCHYLSNQKLKGKYGDGDTVYPKLMTTNMTSLDSVSLSFSDSDSHACVAPFVI